MANTYLPPGQTPLDRLPVYGGAGGSDQAARAYAGEQFLKLFGRNPTESELTQLSAAYMSGDPNRANISGGNSAVAQYYNSLVNSPENQAAQKQKQYEADAPKYYDEINQSFQSTLGRDATDAEKTHFGALRATGNVDAYTVNQFLQNLPEAVTKQDQSFRQSLTSDLQNQDERYFNEKVLPGIRASYLNSGRSYDSSGYAGALAQAASQQNTNRESFLSNLSASQYSGNKQNAYDSYLNSLGRYQGLQDYSRQRSDQMYDATTNRINELQNYALQKQAYDQYLSRYGKRSGQGAGSLMGSALGMGLGAALAAPTGGMSIPMGMALGGSIGGSAGGSIGSFF